MSMTSVYVDDLEEPGKSAVQSVAVNSGGPGTPTTVYPQVKKQKVRRIQAGNPWMPAGSKIPIKPQVKTPPGTVQMATTQEPEKYITEKEYLVILGLFTLANKAFTDGNKFQQTLEGVLTALRTGKAHNERQHFDWVSQEAWEENPDLVKALAKENIFIKEK